jgi:hypothetical protein
MKLRVAVFLSLVCLAVVIFSCRRNQPSLVDANRPPDTELWHAPIQSAEYEWNVHLYWRGSDVDGVATRFIWTITDTLEANPLLRWNPAERVADYRLGRVTARTDSTIAFTAFKNVAGVGLRKNRQAFHIAAIDDNGVIDPSPAVVEFVATVAQLPRVRFNVTITERIAGLPSNVITKPYNPSVIDTVGVNRPVVISYTGTTTNGKITGYKYYSLTSGYDIPGQDVWSSDLSDTLRYFPNVGADELPSGVFRFVAQCADSSSAESRADVKDFTEGVVQIVVNFEPDTRIYQVENTYFLGGQSFRRFVDFEDAVPDTVPYGSWLRFDYRGWDNPRDSSFCTDAVNKCIGYQVQYERGSSRVQGANYRSRWLPTEPWDSNVNGTPDSTTMNIGSLEYTIRARAADELGKTDGSMFDPATGEANSEIKIIGNYDPTLDQAIIRNYDGTFASQDGDTIVWDWWHPANDTTLAPGDSMVTKIFHVEVQASGHDHPTEDLRYGVRGWNYLFLREDDGGREPFFPGQGVYREGLVPDTYTSRFEASYVYNVYQDPGGASLWQDPPAFWNSEYEFSILGRDVEFGSTFQEFVFIEGVKVLQNEYEAHPVARTTQTAHFRFFLKVAR